jgi:hypothetical protein
MSKETTAHKKKKKKKNKNKKPKYNGHERKKKKKDFDEPHVMPNKKTQPIQWTERLSGALVIVGSV